MSEFEESLELLIAKNVDLVPRRDMIEALRRIADALQEDEDDDGEDMA